MRAVELARQARYRLLALIVPPLRTRPRLARWVLEVVRYTPFARARARLFRAFSWPLVCDLDLRLEARVAGGRVVCDTGDLLGRVIAVSGTWEPNATAVVRRLLAPGDVVVDIGAHVGYYTLLAADAVGPGGRVFALEPSPARYRELLGNVERSGATNVSALDAAAGSREGSATLFEAPRPNTSASTLSAGALADPAVATARDYVPVEVRVTRADEVVPANLHGRVRFVKIDVEGHEIDVLRGLEGILARGARIAVLVEVSPAWSPESPAEVERVCTRHRLEPWLVVNDYSLPGLFPTRLRPPQRLSAIPHERCDVLLARGFDDMEITGART